MKRTPEELNELGYRSLLSGEEYNSLFPDAKCGIANTVFGGGYESFVFLVDWVNKYSYQTQKVAKSLKQETLKDTIDAIHWFLFNHIQYRTTEDIYIYSPSCSWLNREEGVDCKSYTVFASCILRNLGVKHYIRTRVNSNKEGHVYVIIPINQKDCINNNSILNIDYYILDGTTPNSNEEMKFIFSYDYYMNSNNKRLILMLLGFVTLSVGCSILSE